MLDSHLLASSGLNFCLSCPPPLGAAALHAVATVVRAVGPAAPKYSPSPTGDSLLAHFLAVAAPAAAAGFQAGEGASWGINMTAVPARYAAPATAADSLAGEEAAWGLSLTAGSAEPPPAAAAG